mmetsp:Transcript_8469/g.30992  ORF Transcript_8469/g.30992 Transcript_8469/m.30992 type:complete len:312 (+) Transcript_8469:1096-2031(+)
MGGRVREVAARAHGALHRGVRGAHRERRASRPAHAERAHGVARDAPGWRARVARGERRTPRAEPPPARDAVHRALGARVRGAARGPWEGCRSLFGKASRGRNANLRGGVANVRDAARGRAALRRVRRRDAVCHARGARDDAGGEARGGGASVYRSRGDFHARASRGLERQEREARRLHAAGVQIPREALREDGEDSRGQRRGARDAARRVRGEGRGVRERLQRKSREDGHGGDGGGPRRDVQRRERDAGRHRDELSRPARERDRDGGEEPDLAVRGVGGLSEKTVSDVAAGSQRAAEAEAGGGGKRGGRRR